VGGLKQENTVVAKVRRYACDATKIWQTKRIVGFRLARSCRVQTGTEAAGKMRVLSATQQDVEECCTKRMDRDARGLRVTMVANGELE
jgi:hypothetical protein